MKKLFKKLLAVALVGAMVGFVGCKDYDDDIDALNNRIDGIENGQIKTINEQIATMQSSISSLQSAQTATQNAVSALQATVATLETKADHAADVAALENKIAEAKTALEAAVAAAKAEHAADKAALEAAIEALEAAHEADVKAVMAEIAALQATDADLKAQIAANEESIAALEAEAKELDATIAKIEESMKEMATMSWVEATLEAYATSEYVAKELGELWATLTPATMRIADLESQMTENNILDQKQQEAIDAAAAALEALEAELEETKKWVEEYVQESVADAGMKLWAKYLEHLSAWVYPDIDALYLKTAETEKALADAYAALEKAIAEGDHAVKAALSSEIDNLQNERAKLEIALKAADEELQKQIDALKGQVAALQALVGETPVAEQIKKAIEENNGVLDKKFLEQAEKIAALKADFDKAVEDLRKQLLAANINIEALMNRIQSIVYVPDYDDLMATVPGIIGYNDDPTTQSRDAWLVGEGEVYMNFRVTPANLAMKVAAVGKEHFTFMLQGLKTRAAEYGLEVLDVAYNPVVEDGLFTVVAQPTLPLEFYKGDKNYAVSLVLDVTNAEVQKKEDNAAAGTATSIMTSYVKLYADTYKLRDIRPGKIVNDTISIVRQYDWLEYTIDWDDTKTEIELLKGYEPYLVMQDRNYDEVKIPYAKAKMMFTLPELTQRVMSNIAYKKDNTPYAEGLGNFVFADENEDACEEVVSLKEAKKEFLGDYLLTEHVYGFAQRAADEDDAIQVVNFTSNSIGTAVKIVKPTRKIYLSPVLYYWWYQDYMTIGADKYEGNIRSFDLEADCSNIVDMTLEEIFEKQGGNAIDVYTTDESGEYTVKTAIKAYINKEATEGEDGEIIAPVRFKHWKFGDNYADAMFKRTDREDIDIEFYVSLNFVGLPEKIEYPMKDQTIAYDATKTIFTANAFDAEAETSPLEDIYALIGADKKENKFFADQSEFVQLVLATDLANDPLTKLNRLATRISGDDEKTKTELTNAVGPFGPQNWYPTSAGLLSPKTADDLFSAFYQIPMAAVVTDADVFDFVTTFTTEPGMAIELTGSAAVELPAYRVKHSKTWVAEPNDEIGRPYFYSDVKGLWSTMSLLEQLTSFSTTKIELESAFLLEELVDGTWQPVAKADKPAYVTYDFNIVPDVTEGGMATLVDAGITIDANNVMSYNGMNESVNVLGKLKVNEVVLSKAFKYTNEKNEEIDYTTYRVFKYDPLEDVQDLKTEEQKIYTSESKDKYEYYIWHNLSLKDKRGAELFANNPAMPNYGETRTNVWNKGPEFKESPTAYFGIDKTYAPEGWTNLSGVQIGQPKAFYVDTNEEADGLEGRIEVKDGKVIFSNMNNLAIQHDVVVRVPVQISYYWGVKPGSVAYYILTGDKKPADNN